MRMGFVRRTSCFFLAATCVFLTGCHSIVYDGNLHFKSYEPETVPMIYDEVADKVDNANRELDANRFDVEGTDAFFILPSHVSDPNEILDFKLLDYTDAGTFIYAYMTEFVPGVDRTNKNGGDPLGGYPDIGQVREDGSIGPATIDMLGDRSVPEETASAGSEEDPDETLPAPSAAPVSEVTRKKAEEDVPPESQSESQPESQSSSSGGMFWTDPSASEAESETETENYTYDPGAIWWGTDPVNGTTASSAAGDNKEPSSAAGNNRASSSAAETTTAEAAGRNDDLWWDTGESEGLGHVDWSAVESEAAARQSSLNAAISSEQASREEASREQASREEASRSTADMSSWWSGEETGQDEGSNETREGLHYNESTEEGESSAAPAAPPQSQPVYKTVELVTVLMAYDPQTRVYKVFYAQTAAKEAQLKKDEATGEEKYELTSTEVTISANKLVKSDQYFIYDNYMGYVYDRDGNELQKHSYYDSISSYYVLLKERASSKLAAAGVKEDEIASRLEGGEFTISNVIMDGSYYVYIPIMFQLGSKPADNGNPAASDPNRPAGESAESEKDIMDMDEDEADEAFVEEVFQTILVSMELDIGGTDPDVKFYSENESWQAQRREWMQIDNRAFYGKDNADSWLTEYSLERLKERFPDRFAAFHTEDGSAMALSLAYVPDIYSFTVTAKANDTIDMLRLPDQSMNINILDLFCKYDRYTSNYTDTASLAEDFTRNYGNRNDRASMHRMFWSKPDQTDMVYAQSLGTLALLAMGDLKMMKQFANFFNEMYRMQVPWMTPGKWDQNSGMNESPVPYEVKTPGVSGYNENTGLEAILACRETEYTVDDETIKLSQFTPVIVPGRVKQGSTTHYSMVPVEWTEKLTRTYSILEQTPRLDANGAEMKDEAGHVIYDEKKETFEQTLDPMPLKYQFLFPEGTKLSWTVEMSTSSMAAPSGDMGVILYEDSVQDGSEAGGAETSAECTMRISNVAANIFNDDHIPGHASDAGVLYHKDVSGNETEIITMITDEGVKFYRRVPLGELGIQNSSYMYAGGSGQDLAYEAFFINSDEFATRTTNYGLYSISESEYRNQGSAGIEGVNEAQNQVIQQKLNTGAGMDAFSIDSFTLLNNREIVAASINEGLFMVNFKSRLAVSLRPGAFYTAVSYRKGASERFMVVGFDTTEYYYQQMDIVKAKCYDMDLASENREKENEAMKGHLATLANNYLNRTHRIEVREADNGEQEAYINEAANDAEKAANEQARKLFFSSEASMQWELYQIVSGAGFGYTQRILDYTTELRKKLLTQREKLNEFYALCGLGNAADLLDPATGMPKDAELREQEGTLLHANYPSTLEHMLVTLKLSEDAIAGMASNQAEYREYRRQMQEAEKVQDRIQTAQPDMYDDEFVRSKDVEKISDQLSEDGLSYLENMDFYRMVLADVTKAYEDEQYEKYGEIRVSWEDYLKELLNAISPDNAVNQQERSFEQFCRLAQIGVSIMPEDQVTELRSRLSDIDRVVDLELLIVEYKLKTAEYQSSSYRTEYEEFQDKTFEEETERVKAVQSAGFYEIIRKLAADAEKEKLLEGTDWESEMSDIVAVCGGGIVLDPNTAELFTEETSE